MNIHDQLVETVAFNMEQIQRQSDLDNIATALLEKFEIRERGKKIKCINFVKDCPVCNRVKNPFPIEKLSKPWDEYDLAKKIDEIITYLENK